MSNRRQFVRQTAAVLIACGLIASLLPGFAAGQDGSTVEKHAAWLIEQRRGESINPNAKFGAAAALARLALDPNDTEVIDRITHFYDKVPAGTNGQQFSYPGVAWVLGLFRDHTIRKHPKQGSPEVPVRLFLTNGEDREALEYITAVHDKIVESQDSGQVRNATPALVRTLYMFGKHFSKDQIERIRASVTNEVVGTRLNSHGTENHAAQFVATLYLLAQYFPDETWNLGGDRQYTSQEVMAMTRDRILQRGRGFYRTGNGELLSTTYDIVSSYPFVNLMEFAQAPEMRDAGEALLLYHLSLQALNNFDGHIMPPFNRRNGTQVRFSPPDHRTDHYMPMHHTAAWVFWGQNEVYPEDFTTSVEPHYTFDYLLADWKMPEVLNRIATGAGAPYEIRGANGRFGGSWGNANGMETLRYVWRDRVFAMGGPICQYFNPSGYFKDYHMFNITWKSENRLRSLEVMHPYWYSNKGEDYWRTTHSPFMQAGLHRKTAIVLSNVPAEDPWAEKGRDDWFANRDQHYTNLIQLAQVRFPATVDELVTEGDYYFFREGKVYVAVRVLKPGHTQEKEEDSFIKAQTQATDWFYVIKSRASQTGFIFETGTADEHGSFINFMEKVKSNPVTTNWDKLEVGYRNCEGDDLRLLYDQGMKEDKEGLIRISPELRINGEKRDITGWTIAESPFVSLKDSVLEARLGAKGFSVDWSGELPRIVRER